VINSLSGVSSLFLSGDFWFFCFTLFPRSKATLQRRRGGLEQQSQNHYEKIVRLPHLPRPRTISLSWQTARTRLHPRFLLTSQTKRNPPIEMHMIKRPT
jgi:hypothetical protein